MAEPQILFEVDEAKILAKLHLAGIMPLSYDEKTEFIVNTGIKNDDPKAKPDNPGKVEFDLGNAQREYEVGFVTTIKYEKKVGIQTIIDQMRELLAKLDNIEGDKSEEKSLTDKTAKKTNELKLVQDTASKINNVVFTKENIHSLADFGFDVGEFLNRKKKKTVKELTKTELDELASELDSVNKKEEKNVEKLKVQYEKQKEMAKTKAIGNLSKYLKAFLGEENLRKFDPGNLVMINISDKIKDSNDPNLVKNYEIVPISDQDRELMLKKFEAHPENCIEKVCFKTGYTIQIDK